MLRFRLPSRDLTPLELGRLGERRAALFYRLRGFRILERNVRTAAGEIDLIVRRGKTLAFVEVKSRRGTDKGAPHEAVDRAKQLRIASLAADWCRRRRLDGLELRFDVVSLVWDGRRFDLEHFPAAFELLGEPGRPWRTR